MTECSVVGAEYSPEGRPEYEQLFVTEDSEAVEHLNELYLEESFNRFSFRDAARSLPNTENREITGLPSERDYPTTEDGYQWQQEIIRSSSGWEKSLPLVDYEEVAVLFPQKRKGINLDELEKENLEVYIGDHISDDELRKISNCEANKGLVEILAGIEPESLKEYIEDNPQLQDDRLDRSVAVYATDNVENNETEEFLWELTDALEKETVDKRHSNH